MLFCYAFTTPFLNKVFLELYTMIVHFILPSELLIRHHFTNSLYNHLPRHLPKQRILQFVNM